MEGDDFAARTARTGGYVTDSFLNSWMLPIKAPGPRPVCLRLSLGKEVNFKILCLNPFLCLLIHYCRVLLSDVGLEFGLWNV